MNTQLATKLATQLATQATQLATRLATQRRPRRDRWRRGQLGHDKWRGGHCGQWCGVGARVAPLAELAAQDAGIPPRQRHYTNHTLNILIKCAGSQRHNTGARAKAWCLRMHEEASFPHGGQGESLIPPYTCGSVSLSRGAGRKPGASLYAQKRLSQKRLSNQVSGLAPRSTLIHAVEVEIHTLRTVRRISGLVLVVGAQVKNGSKTLKQFIIILCQSAEFWRFQHRIQLAPPHPIHPFHVHVLALRPMTRNT